MIYKVRVSKLAAKRLRKLTNPTVARIHKVVNSLSAEPRPHGCKKLIDSRYGLWRVRVGEYRVVYSIDDVSQIVLVEDIDKRDRIYRNPD